LKIEDFLENSNYSETQKLTKLRLRTDAESVQTKKKANRFAGES
jgi:hypothetical protein